MDISGDIAGRLTIGEKAAAAILAIAIPLGAVFLWMGIPALWIWVLSQLSSDYPSVYVLGVLGCPSTMALWGLVLVRLNAAYLRATHGHPGRDRTVWLASLSGERTPRRHSRTLLDTSMTVSVVLAILSILIWFFFYADYQLPAL